MIISVMTVMELHNEADWGKVNRLFIFKEIPLKYFSAQTATFLWGNRIVLFIFCRLDISLYCELSFILVIYIRLRWRHADFSLPSINKKLPPGIAPSSIPTWGERTMIMAMMTWWMKQHFIRHYILQCSVYEQFESPAIFPPKCMS